MPQRPEPISGINYFSLLAWYSGRTYSIEEPIRNLSILFAAVAVLCLMNGTSANAQLDGITNSLKEFGMYDRIIMATGVLAALAAAAVINLLLLWFLGIGGDPILMLLSAPF